MCIKEPNHVQFNFIGRKWRSAFQTGTAGTQWVYPTNRRGFLGQATKDHSIPGLRIRQVFTQESVIRSEASMENNFIWWNCSVITLFELCLYQSCTLISWVSPFTSCFQKRVLQLSSEVFNTCLGSLLWNLLL